MEVRGRSAEPAAQKDKQTRQKINKVSVPYCNTRTRIYGFKDQDKHGPQSVASFLPVNSQTKMFHIFMQKYLECSNVFHPHHKLISFSEDALSSTLALILLALSNNGCIFLFLGEVQRGDLRSWRLLGRGGRLRGRCGRLLMSRGWGRRGGWRRCGRLGDCSRLGRRWW